MDRSLTIAILSGVVLLSCTSRLLKHDPEILQAPNQEFNDVVKIEELPPEGSPSAPEAGALPLKDQKELSHSDIAPGVKSAKNKTHDSKKGKSKKIPKETPRVQKTSKIKGASQGAQKTAHEVSHEIVAEIKAPAKREPEIEDDWGFDGRRPLVDPFRVGEIVTLQARYFSMTAGEVMLKVEPFRQVNGHRSYVFATELKTSSFFSNIYSVEDRAETFLDYFLLSPRVYFLHVKETSQAREAQAFFDLENHQAKFWERKITQKDGVEEKKYEWEILPFSQNVFSAIFYMRVFRWEVGKEYSFRVAHDRENLIFKGKALRKEVLETKLGPKKAIVIQPQIMTKGLFKPVGDIFIWLSDDERRFVLRIESKIRIGTVVGEVVSIQDGQEDGPQGVRQEKSL